MIWSCVAGEYLAQDLLVVTSKVRQIILATVAVTPKGIDDAVRANVRLRSLTISEWYATLRNEPLDEVNRFWSEIGFKP